jgi:ATP-dependent RNA helicase DeaD
LRNFNQLGLSDQILEVLEQIGFETPTPIQEESIPQLLENEGADFIGLAQTGTGKTAAFGLPLLDLIDEYDKHTQALIMAPTRELGQQIAQQLVEFSTNNRKLNVEVVYGGAPIHHQIKALKKSVQIVVATPGRLLDLIGRNAIRLDQVRYVVLDEADEMLNMGFKEDIDAILEHTGDNRAIWLFSATMPPAIRNIVKRYMDSPLEVRVNATEISNKDITHQFVVTTIANKLPALRRFLDIQPDMRGVMFCRTKRETEQIADYLGQVGYSVAALNGDMSQNQRDNVMQQFKTRAMQLLIATDVAARGIDVKDLTHVIHHSLPDQIEYYTHRSGRTGRAGNKGISLAFVTQRELWKIRGLEKRIKIEFEQVLVPGHKQVMSSRINHWANLIVNTSVHEEAEQILDDLHGQFEFMGKDELLKRLISTQLDHLLLQDGNQEDLNPGHGRKKDRKSDRRGDEFADQEDTHRYFINIGTIDGVTKADLLHFLVEISGLNRKYFGDISLQKNCAYFNVNKKHDKGLSARFDGITIEGRNIRVNRDLDKNKPDKSKQKFRYGKKDGKSATYKKKKAGGKKAKGKKKFAGKK